MANAVTDLDEVRRRALGGLEDTASLQFDALLDGLPDAVVYRLRTDADGRRSLIWVSASIERVIGITRDEAMHDFGVWMSALDPSDLPRLVEAEATAVRTGERFRLDLHPTIAGERRTFQIAAKPTPIGHGSVVWDGTVVDVTARADERAARDRLAMMIEQTEDFAAIVDARTGRNVFLNRAAYRMLALPYDHDASALTIEECHPPREARRFDEVIVPAAMRDGTWAGESILRDVNGFERPVSVVVMSHRDGTGAVTHLSTLMRDLSERVRQEAKMREANERAEVALREVNHRVKNLFAIVPAIVQLSARTATDVGKLSRAIRERVGALARSHALTLNAFNQDTGVALDALIRAVLEPYENLSDGFNIDGPAVRLPSYVGNTMSLALHEMATNAVKYGALAAPKGRVSIVWRIQGEDAHQRLHFEWNEAGGPPVRPPDEGATSGFGTTLIDRLIMSQQGTIERDWAPGGLRIAVDLPMRARGVSRAQASDE